MVVHLQAEPTRAPDIKGSIVAIGQCPSMIVGCQRRGVAVSSGSIFKSGPQYTGIQL